jgi:hypothetical protein
VGRSKIIVQNAATSDASDTTFNPLAEESTVDITKEEKN